MAREYDLTAADLGLDAPSQAQGAKDAPPTSTARKAASKKPASKTSSRSGAGVAKYRDPKSGRTWTGFGRAPDWLASAKNREAFLIDVSSTQGTVTAPVPDALPLASTGKRIASKAGKTGTAAAAAKKASHKSVLPARSVVAKRPAVKGAAAKKNAAAGKSGGRPVRKATSVAREQPSAT